MSDRQQVPTLVVGLGGVGSEVVANAYRRLKSQTEIPEHVVFHVLDTDTNTLNDLDGLGDSEETFTQLGGGRVHRISDFRRAFEGTEKWFPYGRVVNSKDTRNGAGQIRAISRLTTLELFSRPGANAGLARAVQRLRAIQARGNKNIMPRVIVVCSLAGGTGSGSFIQIALHLRELIAGRTQDSADSVTVRGFFLLPDAMIMEGQGNIATSQHDPMRANALACIKELEAIRSFASASLASKIELEYSVGGRRRPVEVNPYNAIYLFDLENMKGEGLTKKEHYVEMMSHALHLSLFSPMGDKQLSKEDNRIRDLLDTDGRNIYGSAAVAEIRYPLDDLADYMARRWALEELSEIWLKPDDHVEKLQAEYERDLAQGGMPAEIDPGASYQAFIKQENDDEGGSPRFKKIHIQRFVVGKDGHVIRSKAQEWVEEMQNFLDAKVKEALGAYKGVQFSDPNDLDTGLQAITDSQPTIKTWEQRGEDVRKALPNSLAAAVMVRDAGSEALVAGTQGHRLLRWILDDMHPVTIRAFLYEARDLLTDLHRSARSDAEQSEQAVARYPKAYDLTKTAEIVESLEDRMDEIYNARWPMKRMKWNQLRRQYLEKSRQHVRAVELFTVEKVRELAVKRVLSYLEKLIEAWEALFGDLKIRRATLMAEVDNLRRKHDGHDNRTIRFVYASAETKDALWAQFNARGRQNDSGDAIRKGVEAVYRGFVHTYSGGGKMSASQNAGDFVAAMVDAFRAKVLPTVGPLASSPLPRNIVDAMEMEAVATNRKPQEVVQAYLEDLWPRAVPFIQVTRHTEGQEFSFWGVSSALRERLDPIVGTALRSRGELSYDASFSPNEILYYNVRAGFLASELAKFIPGYQDVGDNRPNGRYFDAYDRLRSDARFRTAFGDKDDQEPLGSHLDKRWADMLPEYWADVIAHRVDRALVKGLTTGLLRVQGDQWVFDHPSQELSDHDLLSIREFGAIHKLRGRIEQRFDMMLAIEKQFEKMLLADQAEHRNDLESHRFIQFLRSVPQSGWHESLPEPTDYNLLALLTELAHGTNSYDRVAEMRMERVFKAACQQVRTYVGIMTGSREEAHEKALAILAGVDHAQALRVRGLEEERELLLDRLALAKRLESSDE
jgi:hypothetical protein